MKKKNTHYNEYFLREYRNFKKNKENETKYGSCEKNFKFALSVQGLGFSGSGAILDLLCEFDNCDVIGSDANAFALANDHKGAFEVDFVRVAGGLFEFEKFLDTDNPFHNDALVNRFVNCISSFPLFRKDKNVRNLFYQFFDELIELEIPNIQGIPFNSFLYEDKDECSIFFLKHISVYEYRNRCKSLLINLINYINNNNKDIIVLDQFFSDMTFDTEKYESYLPETKIIVCYRDPRDVYAFAVSHDIGWIAHDDVNRFIVWYSNISRRFDINANDYLVVQFESLINDYNNVRGKILSYLGLKSENHNKILYKHYFDPNISRNNVGIWKTSGIPIEDFNKIEFELHKFCYFS